MRRFLLSWQLLTLALIQQFRQAEAQYIQGCRDSPNQWGGVNYYYQPTQYEPYKQCVMLQSEVIFLEYNCFYMRDICKNAENFFATQRGRQWFAANTFFGYDFSSGKKARSDKRREASCPTGKTKSWIKSRTCPETDQNEIWRHDGPWPHKDLEPTANDGKTIRHVRDANGKVIKKSGIRYSCDEFPPASWVEGGNGAGVGNNVVWGGEASTRCAAIRCSKGVKAEQNWQGVAHGRLRQLLETTIDKRNNAANGNKPYPYFDNKDSVVFFNFRMTNDAQSGIAAKIYIYTDPTLSTLHRLIGIPQAKRSTDQKSFIDWANTVSMEDLVKMGNVSQHFIFTNETELVKPGVDSSINYLSNFHEEEDYDHDMAEDEHDDGLAAAKDTPPAQNKTLNAKKGKSGALASILAKIRRRAETHTGPRNGTSVPMSNSTELERARQIVKAAMARSIRLNKARLANPRRNHYGSKPGSAEGNRRARALRAGEESHPLLALTDEIVDAAALVSEADAMHLESNLSKRDTAAGGSYWMAHISRKGTVPWGDDPGYKVFRNVRDYGAVGDGLKDDTKAIKRAMNDGRRCGEKCNGSTTKNAIVYFPPGKYRVSSTIPLPFGTQVIGDAGNWPTIVAAHTFIGLGVLSTDEYTGNGAGIDGGDEQWFVNTANFYRQIRNLRIDVTQTRSTQQVACLHYQVAQATSIQNVELIAAPGSGTGIFAENGSGGVISDITFRGGKFGIYGGNQQFTAQRLTFDGCTTGVQLIWDWGWVWKSITMTNVNVGFRLLAESANSGHIGSASFIDSSFKGVDTAILMAPINSKPGSGSTGVIVENVEFQNVAKAVADTTGAVLLAPSGKVEHWVVGPVYTAGGKREFSTGRAEAGFHRQSAMLDFKGAYFERAKPQYEDVGVSDIVHVKDFGARGDGSADDTAAFQAALYGSQGKILFIDAGSYILTSTVTIPPGSKIVGETWSQLVASGSYFEDADNPKVMIKVGKEGDEGDIEMQDLLFTNRGPTAGLILVEWNIKAARPGSAALWDCHVRIGGATGTRLTPQECPPSTSGINPGCNAGSLMMHITPKASGYFENMWLWVADHMIDDPDLQDANNPMVQTSIYVARGFLIESTEPVWLYGTASEHAVFYQYNFNNARNVFAGMIQTESPYYQPTPPPPAPFDKQVGVFSSDPSYNCGNKDELSGCDESWAVVMRGSGNIFVAGAGLYSWFSTYAQDCIDAHACQKAMMLLEGNEYNVRFQHLITIGAKYMAVQNGIGISALDNLNVESHPRWSQVSVFDVSRSINDVWVDPKIWDMQNPVFTCSPPCTAVLPPWTGATTIIDYPLVTVSSGAWTSTITRPPMTVSEFVFQKVTISANHLNARHDIPLESFHALPTLEPTKTWPGISYLGPDDQYTVITPTAKTPPALPTSFGANGPVPPTGAWPKGPMTVIVRGDGVGPFVDECTYLNQQGYCGRNQDFWAVFKGALVPDSTEWFYDETGPEDRGPCPPVPEFSSTKAPEPTKPAPPAPPALSHPSPRADTVSCWNTGDKLKHAEMDLGIESFCHHIGSPDVVIGSGAYIRHVEKVRKGRYVAQYGRAPLWLSAKYAQFSLAIKTGCEWKWNLDECKKFLLVNVDSCDCEGVNGKQGGMMDNNCVIASIFTGYSKPSHDEL